MKHLPPFFLKRNLMEPLLTLLFLFLHFHSSLETREASSIHKVDSSPPGVSAEGASDDARPEFYLLTGTVLDF